MVFLLVSDTESSVSAKSVLQQVRNKGEFVAITREQHTPPCRQVLVSVTQGWPPATRPSVTPALRCVLYSDAFQERAPESSPASPGTSEMP